MLPILCALFLLPSEASASDQASSTAGDASSREAMRREISQDSRSFMMEAGLRLRSLSVPRSILSTQFTEASDDGWPIPGEDRPNVRGLAYGPEFVLKWQASNLFLYFERLDLSWEGGYWDDRDAEGDFLDGSYLLPSDNLGMYAIGADYAAEIHLIRTGQTNDWFGWSLLLGGGLGIGVVTGDIAYWESTPDSALQAYEKYEIGDPPSATAAIPRVLPVVDILAGFRFNIHDRLGLRIEGGLHNALFWGSAVDVMF